MKPRRDQPAADRAAGRAAAGRRFLVVTGLSGSGKSQAIRALEDLGFFCVDNLPTSLIPTLADLSLRAGGEMDKVAIVVDVREPNFVGQFPKALRKLRTLRQVQSTLIFLEASDAVLLRRFSETRRPHPLAHNRPVIEGIRQERVQMSAIRALADDVVDTSDLNVHELRQAFTEFARERAPRAPLVITILSFGYRHGVPAESDLVFDVRCLPNPHFVRTLRHRTGRDRAVVQYMEQHQGTIEFRTRLVEFLRFLVPQYVAEGKSYLTIAVGCTGGRHRSVMMAESLRRCLGSLEGVRLRVRHRDIELGP